MKNNTLYRLILAAALLSPACNSEKPAETPKPAAKEAAVPNAEKPAEATVTKGEEAAKPAEEAAKPAEAAAPTEAAKPAEAPPGAPPTARAPGDIEPPADVAGIPADAEKTATGLASKVITPGTGTKHPGGEDVVTVHYTGWTTDGKMFDSSVKRGQPATFPLNGVIKGWTQGLQLMVDGETRRFWIPADLAYGDKPQRPGAPSGMLVFDVQLLSFKETPKLETPPDVAAAPADAIKTASGLAYKVLTPGKGDVHPKPTDRVTVNYSGWTTDGKMFDSSVKRGQPATFPLNGVIKGWTEGVQLMTVGEKVRFWIPGNLAYGDTPTRPGAPAGTLVFDVELLSIQ